MYFVYVCVLYWFSQVVNWEGSKDVFYLSFTCFCFLGDLFVMIIVCISIVLKKSVPVRVLITFGSIVCILDAFYVIILEIN